MTKHDAVERPKHYPADFFNSICFALDLNKNDIVFFNVLKYVVRHEDKNGLEDIRKALKYLRMGKFEQSIELDKSHHLDTVPSDAKGLYKECMECVRIFKEYRNHKYLNKLYSVIWLYGFKKYKVLLEEPQK